ncbi:hypothetical protein T4D_7655 [Trichinella pseudospiralis]|uniref:Uncharacterized protein n=1 Tax=Trichinella pseudospiralis TaxID=6337 RepID=A0A0V1F7X3_TRIPS|nr:hypothetical protein T4D_7655 [Trichinella pseudospiralis]
MRAHDERAIFLACFAFKRSISIPTVDHGMLFDQFGSVLEKYFKQVATTLSIACALSINLNASTFYYAISSHWPENGTILQTSISPFKHLDPAIMDFLMCYLPIKLDDQSKCELRTSSCRQSMSSLDHQHSTSKWYHSKSQLMQLFFFQKLFNALSLVI